MIETKGFLDVVYDVDAGSEARDLYREWAEGYDEALSGAGYVSPVRCAKALAKSVEDLSAPVLDLGCGTGLSGEALRAAGFTTVDGVDPSEEMLEAAADKDVYRRLLPGDPAASEVLEPGAYAHAAAVGVIGPGHAPAALMLDVMRALPASGCFVFTLNDHALKDWAFEGAVREIVDGGWAQVRVKEHGPHLPGIGLEATVYVLQRY